MVKLIAEDSEVIKGRSGLFDGSNSPPGDKGVFLTSSHHGQSSTLSNNPGVMFSKSSSVGILSSLDQSHLSIFNEVLQKPGEELSEPPHSHEIAAS